MGHTYSSKPNKTLYRYYVCLNAQKRGWHTCPAPSIPAAEIERVVIEQIKAIGTDPRLIAETLTQTRKQSSETITKLNTEKAALERELRRHHAEVRKLALEAASPTGASASRLGDLNERIRIAEQRMTAIREQVLALSRNLVSEREVEMALSAFDPVWKMLSPKEQARVVQLLVKRIDYDGAKGNVSITFNPGGFDGLNSVKPTQEAAA